MVQKSKLPARTLDAAASFRDHPDAIVEAGEIVGMRFPSGGRMSLRAAKLFHLLIQFAGAKIADPMGVVAKLCCLRIHIANPCG